MATDGVKIIDGDHAHDVYHTFMDLYDAGASLPEIAAAVESLNVGDDVDTEIFVTVYALALWEIGELTEAVRTRVAEVIKRSAFATYLTEQEGMPAEGRRRSKVLERFWQKINQPNSRIRKRKNYRQQKTFLFEEGDVLTFQLVPDEIYCVTILLLISQYRSRVSYDFIVHTYVSQNKPTWADILAGKVFGSSAVPGSTDSRPGFAAIGITHKNLSAFSDKFERIEKLTLNKRAQCLGIQRGVTEFGGFASEFRYLEKGFIPFGAKKYSIKNLL